MSKTSFTSFVDICFLRAYFDQIFFLFVHVLYGFFNIVAFLCFMSPAKIYLHNCDILVEFDQVIAFAFRARLDWVSLGRFSLFSLVNVHFFLEKALENLKYQRQDEEVSFARRWLSARAQGECDWPVGRLKGVATNSFVCCSSVLRSKKHADTHRSY